MKIVKKIIEDVRINGDTAVKYYTKKFDKIEIKKIEVTKDEVREAYRAINKGTIEALKAAKSNIEFFAKEQKKQFKNFKINKDGVTLGQRVVPIEKIGVYIPGGNYPLPSTALMCIIPAKIAGVKNVIACSPKVKQETIVAADIAGADKIFRIGGIQAIAAMAYGTKTIPKVDKIVGPGNIYVTAAKKEVFGQCGIDFLAGPSEIMIVADGSANGGCIAADLLAQLEHDINSRAFLITNSKKLIRNVKNEIKMQMKELVTKPIIKKSIKNLKIELIRKIGDVVKIANEIAPEHLELQIRNPKRMLGKLKNYGSLFIGKYSAEVFGDYCSGTNHVLPTNGGARFTSGLSVMDFIKLQPYQKISREGAKRLSFIALKLSQTEGLDAHNKSIKIRLSKTI
ncbi:MAG TPA: histidinol dehydrogenase [Candidatus Nanoarchaeia archaeon]|nr:histidinol dehydrogenase [Candidatus Nanoarchaeia archaeon]